MRYIIFLLSMINSTVGIAETSDMTKIDPPLAQALANYPEDAHAVIILCEKNCDPVERCLKEMGAEDVQLMRELNMMAVTLNAKQVQAIEKLDAVSYIELDAELGID